MASPNIYPNGIGGSTGASLATAAPFYGSGDVWYVSSVTGVDASGTAGKDRVKPLATLAQAYTNAAAGDTIVCLENHAETLTSAQTLGKAGLVLLGEGAGSSRPRFTRNADINMFDVTAAGVVCWNIYFPASTTTSTKSRFRTAAVMTELRSCYFECGASDTGPAAESVTGASQFFIRDTSFVSTATAVASQPHSALKVTNALTDLELDTVTFDGGSTGWSNQFALNGAAAVTRLRGLSVDLLHDSDISLVTGTTGFLTVRYKSGSARTVWAA